MIDCHPDLQTQLPVICEQNATVPSFASYPVAPDGEVSLSAKFGRTRKALLPFAEWGCAEWRARGGLIALIFRCAQNISVAVLRLNRSAPNIVHVEVAGANP